MATVASHIETSVDQLAVAGSGGLGAAVTGPLVVPPDISPNIDHIITEDGAPVDNVFSEKQQRLLTETLYASWRAGRQFVAMSNVGLFFAPKYPPFVPDALLSVDVRAPNNLHPKANRSYFVWEYGKPPNVVIEIVSNKEGGEDTVKLAGYASIGIAFYVIYDPELHLNSDAFRVFELNGMSYVRLAPITGDTYQLSGIGLGLTLWRGQFEGCDDTWLRWIDGSGNLVSTGEERAEMELQHAIAEKRRADAEQQRADTAEQRADTAEQRAKAEQQRADTQQQRADAEQQLAQAEQQRADAEQQRADAEHSLVEAERNRANKLAELLRQMGVNPDQ